MEESVLNNICRACLTEHGEFQFIFVRDESTGLDIHLAEMIMAYASVQITFGDGLPEQICLSCANKAVEMYMFKKQCEESDACLRQRLGKSPLLKVQVDSSEGETQEFEVDVKEGEVLIKSEVCNNIVNLEEKRQLHQSCEYIRDVVEDNIYITKTVVYECNHCLQQFKELTHIKLEQKNDNESNPQMKESRLETEQNDITVLNTPTLDGFNISRIHTGHKEKPGHECYICNRKFTKTSHLTRHLKIHNPIKPHACKVCYKRYARLEQLTTHMNIHMGVKPHVCDICFKGFNQISNLKDHMRTHNGEKPFLCSTCGKGFNQLGNLRQHTIRHSGIKAHICTFCGNGFASKGELCAHVRKHTGARPFVCPVCNHGFTTSSSLTKHKRIHSGEKPYECDVCHMRFSRSGILARHKRTHTGEKPYVCNYCAKAFSQSNDLSSHLRIHTGEKPFICDMCGSAFRQSSALKTHKKTHADRNAIIDSKVMIVDSKMMMGMVQHQTFLGNLQ
ncbi:zinc finger protein [Holotrichia oblita]|uniref:Zinc finger protein n=1 Tax=Holotrichia oblita TaxID=644536 RepID=A0ACB9TEI3_HOLOL|nr:zinc finger protein [Holotrichia oblita]